MTVPTINIVSTLNYFNSTHQRLQTTVETSKKNEINLLDVTLIQRNKKIITDWYLKPTFSGRYLNFFSQYSTCQKRGTAIGLIDSIFLLSHPSFHTKNITKAINIFLDNNYLLEFIFNTFDQRLKTLIKNNQIMKNKLTNGIYNNIINNSYSYFTIPYVPKIAEQFKNVVKNIDVKLSYYSI